MGAVPSRRNSDPAPGGRGQEDIQPIIERKEAKRRASSRRESSVETVDCPTCQGTGRIPRGQENKLVAVIPCNDQRLRPRHTKLYVAVSVAVCFLVSALVLFFLFPRSVLLSPVAVQSSFVYFTEDGVQINITNVLNITNHNFVAVEAYNLTVQALYFDVMVGSVAIQNVTSIKPLSVQQRLLRETIAACSHPLPAPADVHDGLLPGALRAAVPGGLRVRRLWSQQHHAAQRVACAAMMARGGAKNAVSFSVAKLLYEAEETWIFKTSRVVKEEELLHHESHRGGRSSCCSIKPHHF